MSETARAVQFEQPPDGITPEPLTLDGVLFRPSYQGRIEVATRGGNYVGEVLLDLEQRGGEAEPHRNWFARKADANGDVSDWKEMRCVHEARAFIVSGIKQ